MYSWMEQAAGEDGCLSGSRGDDDVGALQGRFRGFRRYYLRSNLARKALRELCPFLRSAAEDFYAGEAANGRNGEGLSLRLPAGAEEAEIPGVFPRHVLGRD